jgi:undecaprenyl-diphosphatase
MAGACATVFLALAVGYHDSWTAGPLDRRLLALLPDGHGVRRTLHLVADAAPLVALAVVVGTTTALVLGRRWREAAFAAVGPAATMLLAELGKLVIGRHRGALVSLPSGHTAGITTVAVTVGVLLLQRAGRHVVLAAALGWLAATLLGGGMALVMVAIQAHYPTDTLAGYCLAVATTIGVAFGIDRLTRRRLAAEPAADRPRPAPPPADATTRR